LGDRLISKKNYNRYINWFSENFEVNLMYEKDYYKFFGIGNSKNQNNFAFRKANISLQIS